MSADRNHKFVTLPVSSHKFKMSSDSRKEELERQWSEVDGKFPGSRPVTAVVVGCGNRGQNYGGFALDFPHRMKVVAVAEHKPHRRKKMREQHKLAEDMVFSDWKELAEKDKLADCAIISTQDRMHMGPAVALAKKGYHLLLEKPMSSEEPEVDSMSKVFKETGVIVAVCHVLRYAAGKMHISSNFTCVFPDISLLAPRSGRSSTAALWARW